MPLKDGTLTPREAMFTGYMASTGDATYSAAKAGYPSPQVDGWKRANNPALMATVRKAQAARVTNELLPIAVDLLHHFLTDTKETSRIRLEAVKVVFKHSLGAGDGADDKDPHEMTTEELQARLDTLRRAAADRARPVIEGQAIEGPDPAEMGVFD